MMLDYCRNLKFEETPNYEYLYKLVDTIFKEKNLDYDYKYDWVVSSGSITEAGSPIPMFTEDFLSPNINIEKEMNKNEELNKPHKPKELIMPDK